MTPGRQSPPGATNETSTRKWRRLREFCAQGGRGQRTRIWWSELLVAGVVSIGVIVIARPIITRFSIARHPPHDPSKEPALRAYLRRRKSPRPDPRPEWYKLDFTGGLSRLCVGKSMCQTILATIAKLTIAEFSTTLFPDGRDRPSHLRRWRDG